MFTIREKFITVDGSIINVPTCRCGASFSTDDELNDHWNNRECHFWS